MQLALSEEQRLLQETLRKLFSIQSTMARVRQCEPLGFDRALWNALWDLEVPSLRTPGLSDASLLHAIIAAEEAGRALASVPLVEALAAQRLLAQLDLPDSCGHDEARAKRQVIALALGDMEAERSQLLSSGAIADAIIGLSGDSLWLLRKLNRQTTRMHGSIPACALKDVQAGERVKIGGPEAARQFRAAVEEWRLLNAAQVTAAGMRAIEIAAEYACEREAFGRKIGEFQGVAHPLADAFTDLDGAQLICRRAADAIAHKERDAGALISMAAWWSGVAARPAARCAMRMLGGYGMTMEYDPQLYFRRINMWSLAAGSPDRELDRAAARLWQGADTSLPDAGEIGIDFGWGPEGDAAAERMRAFCKRRHDTRMSEFMRDSLDGFDLALQREMAAAGLLYPDASSDYGGPGHSATVAAAVRDVWGDHYWNLVAPNVTDMIAKIILHFGTDTARAEILPRVYAGETYCTLGYSEPSCGSDVFAVRTTAKRDGDAWLINGQKMFTSMAHRSDYALMITRTGPDKYRGITVFIVPLRQDGFALTEIKTIGDERTNVTFYKDVRVPDAYRIGAVDGGAKVLAAALTIEQASGDLHVMSLKYLLHSALEWARATDEGPAPIERAEIRRALVETATRLAVQDAMNRRSIWAYASGEGQKHYGPMAKLFGSESWMTCSARLLEAAAPASLPVHHRPEGAIEFLLRRSIPSTIYAGTSEVQRSLVAEAGLGLPRSR